MSIFLDDLHAARHEKPQIALAVAVVAVITVAGALAVPYGSRPLGANVGFLPAFGSLTFMGDLITALLLLSQARAVNDRPLAYLGSAYLFSAAAIIPHLAAFPGVFGAQPLIGTSASAVWLWVCWHGGYALGIVNFALRKPSPDGQRVVIWPFIVAPIALAVCAALLATLGEPYLPTILVDGSYARMVPLGISPAVLLFSFAAMVLVMRRLHRPSILMVWLTVAIIASLVDVALTMLGAARFTAGWYVARCLSLVAGYSVLCALLIESVRLFTRVADTNRQLEKLSLTDPLTQIGNRRLFERRLDEEWRRAAREQIPLSLVMIDIDQFKLFNDALGHPAGDACLQAIAAALSRHSRRPFDMPARLGGEEFAVILPNTEEAGALNVAEMFRATIERLALPHPTSTCGIVTISAGVATAYPQHAAQSATALIHAADTALYAAKAAGRNRVQQQPFAAPVPALSGLLQPAP